jgi:hypothetical protein
MKKNLFLIFLLFPWFAFASAGELDNFWPGETVRMTATTTAASMSFSSATSLNSIDLMIVNEGPSTAYYGCDGSGTAFVPSSTPSINATPIFAGAASIFRKYDTRNCAFITGSGTAVIEITAGQGN